MNRRIMLSRLFWAYTGLLTHMANAVISDKRLEADVLFRSLLSQLTHDPRISVSIRRGEDYDRPRAERAVIRTPKSSRRVSDRARDLVIACEVTNEHVYDAKYQSPTWPHGNSGVTVGVGYDLGYTAAMYLVEDWGSYLDAGTLELMSRACGRTGSSASQFIKLLANIRIAWPRARAQFDEQVLPRYVALTEAALPHADGLSADSFGALVSLVYNRGASFNAAGDRYNEMRAIRELMEKSDFKQIPAQIQKMKRLWAGRPELRGLLIRRDAEAALFNMGLQ